ncbi:MAG: cupin domain-containing protein [Planctomycetes bacterium]|nr:cupin domain-containing protein [Planctomycetota bacterium]
MTDPVHERRPWGEFRVLADSASFRVKRIDVRPGQRLSYQRHQRRAEHWMVVEGRARVTLEGVEHDLVAGQAIDIPLRAWHRIACTSDVPLVFIEIQTGSYFGEDDIERRSDDYGRASSS